MISRILLPLDGSALAEQVIDSALAVGEPFSAEFLILRVVEPPRDADCAEVVHWRFLCAEAAAYLQATERRLRARGVTVRGELAEGDPAAEILRCARQRDVDLVVMGTHGRSPRQLFPFGTTIQQVVNSVALSVMIVPVSREAERDAEPSLFRNVLVPLDGSRRAELALGLADSVAAAAGAALHVAHVVPVPELLRHFPRLSEDEALRQELVRRNQRAARDYLDGIEKRHGDRVARLRCHLLTSSRVSRAIQQLVREQHIDLIVGCAHGHGGEDDWLYGSVAGSLIAHAEVPLLIFQDLAHEATIERSSGEWSVRGVRDHLR
jgi:nucleotide-binding universal stress UspA family protein